MSAIIFEKNSEPIGWIEIDSLWAGSVALGCMHKVTLALSLVTLPVFSATITHNLNVQIVQVFNDAGGDGAPIASSSTFSPGASFLYQPEVNEIWEQAGIQVTYLPTVSWNNTEAQRLTTSERSAIYGDTYTSTTGDPLPNIPTDALQIFFVWDHPGTGYDGSVNSGWKNDTGFPNNSAQNAGNAQLGIEGFVSNGRSVMANRGFATEQLSGTLAHEIGHALGLRHVDEINMGAATGGPGDPDFSVVPLTDNNLMWSAGVGPGYDGSQDNDPNLTILQENEFLRPEQVAAAISNGLALDPDGNGIGVLQPIPEPSALLLLLAGLPALMRRRR